MKQLVRPTPGCNDSPAGWIFDKARLAAHAVTSSGLLVVMQMFAAQRCSMLVLASLLELHGCLEVLELLPMPVELLRNPALNGLSPDSPCQLPQNAPQQQRTGCKALAVINSKDLHL